MSSTTSQDKSITPEELIDLLVPGNVRISPNGTHVIYHTASGARKDEHNISIIWLASFGKEKSSRQLTSGSNNDRNAEWSPDSTTIAFLSDREKSGKTCAIYAMSIHGGEAYPITDASHEADISSIAWSPNGQFIAFTSSDEKSDERKTKDEKKDDVKVYGEDWRFNRLRILHVSTREVRTVFKDDAHVYKFAWSPDSKGLVVVSTKTPEVNSPWEFGSVFDIVNVNGREKKKVCDFPGALWFSKPLWHDDKVFFQSAIKPGMLCSAQTVYSLDVNNGKYESIGFGDVDSVEGVRGVNGCAAVHVQADMEDKIVLLDGETMYKVEQAIGSFDILKDSSNKHLLVLTTSNVSTPTEVYSKSSSNDLVQLSDHGASIRARFPATTYKTIRCKSFDGKVDLDAYWAAPSSATSPLPALIHTHGGPYSRVTNTFDASYYHWFPYILSTQRYGILSVNYRGGSGRGNDFAATAAGGMGTVEYDDVLAVVQAAVEQNLVDKEKLVAGGWSQGGFLSYLSAVRNGATKLPNGKEKNWRFQAAICGAGVTDWDMITMSSDAPLFEGELAGGAPWECNEKKSTGGRQGSAIWEFAAAAKEKSIPPILILHGELDERVPVSQAVAFHRGCLKWGVECEMAVYPREPHGFKERAHKLDLLKRVLRFIDARTGG